MKFIYKSKYKTITSSPSRDDLPDLVVITGANGAGKTQLLEAIRDGHLVISEQADQQIPPALGPARMMSYLDLGAFPDVGINTNSRDAQVQQFEQLINHIKPAVADLDAEARARDFRRRVVETQQINDEGYDAIETAAGVSLLEWTHADFVRYSPTETSGDLFTIALGNLFGSHASLQQQNNMAQYQESKGKTIAPASISDEEFEHVMAPLPGTCSMTR